MNCKHCGAELEENAAVCAFCGQAVEETAPVEETAVVEEIAPVEEETPVVEAAPAKKKTKKRMGKAVKAVIAVSLALVLLLGMAVGVIAALGFNFESWENELTVKDRYTAPDFMAKLSANTVVATLGDKELTNGMLQLYYGRQIWDLLEEYGGYLGSLGLDLSKPLHEQEFPGAEGATWEQYFVSMAIDAWFQQQTLVCMAEEAGYQYPEGLQTFLDTLESGLNEQAVANGLKDGNALIQKEMGAIANIERYKAYAAIYNQGMEYYGALYESLDPEASQVEAYFEAHADELQQQYGVTKVENPVIDVRHILLTPEGGTEDPTTGRMVYNDEEMAACHQKAQALLDRWKSGEATEESFALLANEHSTDPGSNTKGGLYEYVYQGDMVEAFDAWCFDESRKPGDTGVVDTPFGCHIMYFVYGADEWYRVAYEGVRTELCQKQLTEAFGKYPSQVDYYKISLSAIDFE